MTRPRHVIEEEVRAKASGRLPPGQTLTEKWPVLHDGPVPVFNPALWDFRVWGEVETALRLGWDEFNALPRVEVVSDFHCVTAWSRFDNRWEGVSLGELARRAGVKPSARFIVAHAEYGYTANLPLDAVLQDDVLCALEHDGAPLTPDHGYPLRLIVPKRYAWKSAKWLRGLEFSAKDQPGYWEVRGYHNEADPWREERFG
jgi:DMSO/TMAO reductase YedYZ molybdopterin-dependent catalytic subunit